VGCGEVRIVTALLFTVLAFCPVKAVTGGALLVAFAATPAIFAEHPRQLYTNDFWLGAIVASAAVLALGVGGTCESPDSRRRSP